jgi:hypothetical protein
MARCGHDGIDYGACRRQFMKLYKVVLADGREEFVPADSYSEVDDHFVFYRGGQPIPDVFFKADSVLGINVESDNYECSGLYSWRRDLP